MARGGRFGPHVLQFGLGDPLVLDTSLAFALGRKEPARTTAFTLIHSTCIANDIRNHSHRNASVSSASESLSLSFFAIMVTNPLNVT